MNSNLIAPYMRRWYTIQNTFVAVVKQLTPNKIVANRSNGIRVDWMNEWMNEFVCSYRGMLYFGLE